MQNCSVLIISLTGQFGSIKHHSYLSKNLVHGECNKVEKSEHIYVRSNRLILRQFSQQDVNSFYLYRSSPEVAKFQSWENYQYHNAELFVREQSKNMPDQPGTWFQFAIALVETNHLIGDCALHTLLDELSNCRDWLHPRRRAPGKWLRQ